ncbi:ABC-type bacteriocin/lantibiotic exporter with double-glycine peptidase domain [Mucilaginibacter sp. HD30]
MKTTHQFLKFFVGQSGPSDCGIACMAMILNYTGRPGVADRLLRETSISEDGLSLLELRHLAATSGLTGECVRMDFAHLREAGPPLILHVGEQRGDHFVVCFGSRRKGNDYHYLIADPATGVQFIAERDLESVWHGQAALYFEGIRKGPPQLFKVHWMQLLQIKGFRKVFLLTVPLLNLCATLMGICISWMLQRGLDHPVSEESFSILAALISLLFIITLFKNIVNYIRRHLLITLGTSVSHQLISVYINNLVIRRANPGNHTSQAIRKALGEIRNIQNALVTLIAVMVSEGLILTSVIAALFFFDPLIGLVNIVYLGILHTHAVRCIPGTAVDNVKLQTLLSRCEDGLVNELNVHKHDRFPQDLKMEHNRRFQQYQEYARSAAVRMSRYGLMYESAGTVNVIIVFAVSIYKVQGQQINYPSLMVMVILSYFVTVLVPKVGNAFPVVAEGALQVRRFLNP